MNHFAKPLFNYCQALFLHDWTHEFSDDHSAWQAGRNSLGALLQMQPKVDPDFVVWDMFAPSDFKRGKAKAPPAVPAVPAGYKLLKNTTPAEREWAEDASHENGCCHNTCSDCGRMFVGHKRRVICKSCAAAPAAPAPEVAAQVGEREAFEAWAAAEGFCVHRDGSEKYSEYHKTTTRWAWKAWQARAAHATQQHAGPEVRGLTDADARILQEAERVKAADSYFKARAWMLDTAANRRFFEAGFDAAWGVKLAESD